MSDFDHPFRQEKPPKAETTRLDQLKLKAPKDKDNDANGEGGKGRGRGRGGRGKGRGRGRGNKPQADEAEEEEEQGAKGNKRKKGQDTTTKGKQSKNEIGPDDWDEWANYDAWARGWWDEGYEAWDNAAYYDYVSWEVGATYKDKDSKDESKTTHEGSTKQNRGSRKKNSNLGDKPDKSRSKTEEKTGASDNADQKSKEEKEKPKKRKVKHSDNLDVKPEKVKAPKEAPQTTQDTAGNKAPKRKPTVKDETAADPSGGPANGKKRARQTTPNPAEADQHPAAKAKAKGKARAATAQPAVSETEVEKSKVLPPTKEGRVQEVVGFCEGFKGMCAENAYIVMRGRLQDFRACRMNVYWKRTAVGLTCRAEKKDFAYFRAENSACPEHYRMAAALKGAEMLAPLMHLIERCFGYFPKICFYNLSILQIWKE